MTNSKVDQSVSVCLLNYGCGNVGSVFNVLRSLNIPVIISNSETDIVAATHLILPGVGSFANAMELVKSSLPLPLLEQEVLVNGKPFLGICVGMQILAKVGFEFGEHEGLGWVQGEVKKLQCSQLPLPHVGWNDVASRPDSRLFRGIRTNSDFYFVHSFAIYDAASSDMAGWADYGGQFLAAIERGNLCGVQFHPEKSQTAGKLLLENFVSMSRSGGQ